jgi:hypothetical protein
MTHCGLYLYTNSADLRAAKIGGSVVLMEVESLWSNEFYVAVSKLCKCKTLKTFFRDRSLKVIVFEVSESVALGQPITFPHVKAYVLQGTHLLKSSNKS